jgi:SAM-dependent MidA family methyltransferase
MAASAENIIASHVPTLADRLRKRIRREGPISFLDYMEAALYDAQEGYYAARAPIGEPGDFVTSPHVSPAFAGAIARRFRRDAERLPGPVDFVEVGAGEGRFLEDFARQLGADAPEILARLRLTAVERSARGRELLAQRAISPPPRILTGAEELAERSISGWVFSNELYDALPVARVAGTDHGIDELRVGLEEDRFAWVAAPAPPEIAAQLARAGVALTPGQIGEVRPGAAPLHRRLSSSLTRGLLVAFDYGHRAKVLYHPLARRGGTLAVHSGGRRGGDPLSPPGSVDLTAHVNWDELVDAGEEEGLLTNGIFRQGIYLAESGIMELASDSREKWRVFRLIDPEGMGEEISVLVQSKGI